MKDLQLLTRSGALSPGAVLVADNVLKPGAPKFLWQMVEPGPWRSVVVELKDFGPCGVLDWMSVSRWEGAEAVERHFESEAPELVRQLEWQADEMRWRSWEINSAKIVPTVQVRLFSRV